jgi:WD40 repeat protein
MNFKQIHTWETGRSALYSLAFVPQKSIVYATGSGNRLVEINLNDQSLKIHSLPVNGVYSLNYGGHNSLLIGSMAGQLIRMNTGNQTFEPLNAEATGGIYGISNADEKGDYYTTHGNGELQKWNQAGESRVFSLSSAKIRSTLFHQGLLYVFCGDGQVRICDPESGNVLKTLSHERGAVNTGIISGEGKLVTAGWDGRFYFWNELEFDEMLPVHNYAVYALRKNPSGNLIASASRDKSIKIWTPDLKLPLAKLERTAGQGHTHSVNDIQWIDDSFLLSTGDDGRIILWGRQE